VQWTFIAIIFMLANGAGYTLVKFRKQGISALAGVGGAMIGFIIARSIAIESKAGYWAIVIGCAFAVAIVAFYIEK